MIKINLVKSRIGAPNASSAAPTSQTFIPSYPTAESSDARQTLIKILLVAIFTGLIMLYEHQNIQALSTALNAQNAKVAELDQKAQAKAKEVEGIADIEKRAKELEDKLKVLRQLSKLRLREVKTLDFIQGAIPEKVWVKALNFEADHANAELGHFNFSGLAVTTEELTEFVKRLEDSAYLSEVIVMKNQEIAAPGKAKASLRDYTFTAQVEAHVE